MIKWPRERPFTTEPGNRIVSDPRHTVRTGLVVGLIGYASVAAFYSAFDLLAARGMLYTVNVLGLAVFRGLRDPEVLRVPLPLDARAIVEYNALHLLVALAIGLIVTGLAQVALRTPALRHAVRLIIVAGFVVTVGAVALLTTGMRPMLPLWSIVVANALATVLAGWYLVRQRPGLWRLLALAQA